MSLEIFDGLIIHPLAKIVQAFLPFQPIKGKCLCGTQLTPHTTYNEMENWHDCFIGIPNENCGQICGYFEAEPWFCGNCNKLYHQCDKCKSWLFLIGHSGWKINDTQWSRRPFEDVKKVAYSTWRDYGIGYEDNCFYNVTDLYLTYLDTREWQPTGPSGGSEHVWHCFKCNEQVRLTDK